jgi:hypothetical protein
VVRAARRTSRPGARAGLVGKATGDSLARLFRKDLVRFTLLCTLTSAFVMFAYWGLFSWIPGFLAKPLTEGGAGLGDVKAPIWTIPMNIGALIGYATFGFISDKIVVAA